MQWLGIGDWDSYMELPADVVAEAIHLMRYEHDERKRMDRHYEQHRGTKGRTPKYRPRDYVSPLSIAPEKSGEKTIIDEDGHKRVVRERPDGTVARHREIAPADITMWLIAGQIPKSFRGKVSLDELVGKRRKDGD